VAQKAGLRMNFTSGNEHTKKYIIEANGTGVAFLDYDNDGRQDIFLVNGSRLEGFREGESPTNHLYRNLGGRFEDVTRAANLARSPLPGRGSNCEWKGMGVFCGPRGMPFGKATLYHNRGDGTFEDVSEKAGVRSVRDFYAFTAVAADLNEDGWTDLYIACDST